MRVSVRILILGLAAALASAAPAAARAPAAAVGVCLRWGPADDHVQDVVIVSPSGNPVLDAALPDAIRQMVWRRPAHPALARDWVGVWMSVDGAPLRPSAPPSCADADRRLADTRPAPAVAT